MSIISFLASQNLTSFTRFWRELRDEEISPGGTEEIFADEEIPPGDPVRIKEVQQFLSTPSQVRKEKVCGDYLAFL